MKVTNTTRQTLDFTLGSKDGVAETLSVDPGETKEMDLDPENAQVKGALIAGAITISGKGATAALRDVGQTVKTVSGDTHAVKPR